MISTSIPQAIVYLLDRNYRYTSEAIQIPVILETFINLKQNFRNLGTSCVF